MQLFNRSRYRLLLIWSLGLIAAVLRSLELRMSWDKELMVFDNTSPYMEILLVFTGLFLGGVFLWVRRQKNAMPLSAETAEIRRWPVGFRICGTVSVLLLLASGVFDAKDALSADGGLDWPILIFALLTLLSAAAVAVTQRETLRGRIHRDTYGLYTLAPVFWATYGLILTFRETPTLPANTLYIFDSLSVSLFMLTFLFEAGLYFQRARPRRILFFAVTGLFFSIVAVVSQSLYLLSENQWIYVVPSTGHCLRLVFLLFSFSYMLYDALGRAKAEVQSV